MRSAADGHHLAALDGQDQCFRGLVAFGGTLLASVNSRGITEWSLGRS